MPNDLDPHEREDDLQAVEPSEDDPLAQHPLEGGQTEAVDEAQEEAE